MRNAPPEVLAIYLFAQSVFCKDALMHIFNVLKPEILFEGELLSTDTEETCIFCIEQEVAKLLSLCFDLGLELTTRQDVRNLILVSEYSPLYRDPAFIESVIDVFLEIS